MTSKRRAVRAGSAATPSGSGTSPANVDEPIPSIEDRALSDDTSTTTSHSPRFRTPSVSVSPPASSRSARSAVGNARGSRTAAQARSESHGIDSALNLMRLSSPDGIGNLSDVANAIDAVGRGSDSRSVSLAPEDQSSKDKSKTREQSSRRRRSSSKVVTLRHDVKDEELPKNAFHDPSFQQAFRDAKNLMSNMRDVLGSTSLHNDPDSTMRRLHKEAGDLAGFKYPSTRTVGFVGDSGVGKSSLLNSLLDSRGLARTHDTLAIDVELFSMEEIKDQLLDLLQSYRHFHFNQNDMETAEREDMEEIAKRARYTFHSMFCNRMSDDKFLVENSEDKVLRSLISWAADARPSEIASRESGLSLETCSAKLMQLSSEPASERRPSKWPFIKKIKLFLNAHILSKGLVLVDLPGLRDMNVARRTITERFLLECDEIFVVCNIGRAVTDAGVEAVFELARQAKLSNVGIICTRSDDIQAEEAKKDWKGQKSRNIQRLIDAVAADMRDFDNIESELAEYVDEDDLSDNEIADQLGLLKRQKLVRKRTNDHRLHAYLVTTRNANIDKKLHDLYSSKVPSGDLRVFCVSNKDYWDHRDEPRDTALPHLALSCILEVRKYCISIVANSQRRIAACYMRDEIPALLAQIELWVQSGAGSADAERKEVVRCTLTELEGRLKRDLSSNSSSVNNIARSMKEAFLEQIYQNRRIPDWSESAMEAGYEWSTWHHASYAAFCRQYGDYSTPAAGSHNWNEEAIDGMVKDLKRPWKTLCSHLVDQETQVESLVEELTDWSIQYLGRGSDARRKGIMNDALACEDLFSDLMRNFRRIFRLLAKETQEKINAVVATYLTSIHGTLQIILNDNVALESEQDPAFRHRVGEAVSEGKDEIDRIKAEISD
ncbi:hypothetical protein G7Z17_g6514 [Cylindrodendrum hubeiense]|uniref:Nuclear GTPase SLIP-GC n=1 Tax=Cylindrodendrum hubeiense TaxID=595255 RepID=A0A9P5LGQ5_9HYPO|nr:hypothetical protein G7Z17_g6514 [Cylindrodendrum hubeiense]